MLSSTDGFIVCYEPNLRDERKKQVEDACQDISTKHGNLFSIRYFKYQKYTFVGAKFQSYYGVATVGCFVRHRNRLYGISCRHALQYASQSNKVISFEDEPIDKTEVILPESINANIGAFMIPKHIAKLCNTKFRSSTGQIKPCRLFDGDVNKLIGKTVHIRGATTPLGTGVITSLLSHTVFNHMSIESLQENIEFGKPGDSGAVVFAEDEGELLAISILMGKLWSSRNLDSTWSYLSYSLRDGLKELENAACGKFELFTSDPTTLDYT